jgi:leader peptidase (prepilin peptidase) / N-methyltransferase
MLYLILTAFFIFATIIGSFLNVVIYRYNTGLSVAKGRSKCFSCGHTLEFQDLVPVLSYVYNKGRCRHCKTPISLQYPLVEILTGVVLTTILYMYFFGAHAGTFIGVHMFSGASVFQAILTYPWLHTVFFVLDGIIASLFIAIGVYDLKHKIIPDGLVYTAAIIAFVKVILGLYFFGSFGTFDMVTTLLAGILTALPFGLLWLVSGGRWMGLGDAKLALVIGWALGISNGFMAIVYSFWIGCIGVLGIMLIRELVYAFSDKHNVLHVKLFNAKTLQRLTDVLPALKLKSELPFGPYMIIGFYVVYITGKTLFGL